MIRTIVCSLSVPKLHATISKIVLIALIPRLYPSGSSSKVYFELGTEGDSGIFTLISRDRFPCVVENIGGVYQIGRAVGGSHFQRLGRKYLPTI